MVEAVRAGQSLRVVARKMGVSLWTVQRWVARAGTQALDGVDWANRSRAPQRRTRTPAVMEAVVLRIRQQLRDESALGEFGAPAIRAVLQARGVRPCPAASTIGRILQRRGAVDYRRRVRYPSPPPGWYLPAVRERRADVDCMDAIEDRALVRPTLVDIVTCVSLHGGLPGAWPGTSVTSKRAQEALEAHWRAFGLPAYVQFDNDPVFAGPHRFPRVVGRVLQLCLSLQVVPVFVPAREMGFQASIEAFNARWQAKVWHRFHHRTVRELTRRSDRYLHAYRQRLAPRLESAPPRRPFPRRWRFVMGRVPAGQLIYLRRVNERGEVKVLGVRFPVGPVWANRLVRCEVSVPDRHLRIYALRRRAPAEQPLLRACRGPWQFYATQQ